MHDTYRPYHFWPSLCLSVCRILVLCQNSCTYSLTHCCAWPARAIVTSTTSDPAPMTTASRLCTPWSSSTCCIQAFLGQPGGRFQSGKGICPARGWHSAGGCCGLAHLVVGGKHVLAMSVFCQLWWEVDPSVLSGSERNHWWQSHTTLCSGCAVVPSCEKPAVGPSRLWSESTSQIHAARRIEQGIDNNCFGLPPICFDTEWPRLAWEHVGGPVSWDQARPLSLWVRAPALLNFVTQYWLEWPNLTW